MPKLLYKDTIRFVGHKMSLIIIESENIKGDKNFIGEMFDEDSCEYSIYDIDIDQIKEFFMKAFKDPGTLYMQYNEGSLKNIYSKLIKPALLDLLKSPEYKDDIEYFIEDHFSADSDEYRDFIPLH